MKHFVATALIATALATPASAERMFICEETASTGFKLKEGTWEIVRFTADARFLVTINGAEFKVSRFGGSDFLGDCAATLGATECIGWMGNFHFNSETLRFVRSYTVGYIDGDRPDNTPLVAIGTCAEM